MKNKIIIIMAVFIIAVLSMSGCETPENSFTVEDTNAGIKITAYLGNDKKIVIPSTINNKKVVEIDRTVFSGNIIIEEITLPKYMGNLDLSLFSGCDSLKTISFPGEISSIYFCPEKLPSLDTINIGKLNSIVSEFNNLYSETYSEKIINLKINDIDEDIFENLSSYSIGSYHIKNDIELNVTIPQDVIDKFDYDRFYYDSYQESINKTTKASEDKFSKSKLIDNMAFLMFKTFHYTDITINGTQYDLYFLVPESE